MLSNRMVELEGKTKLHKGVLGVWFDGPPETPENALFIPLNDFGYSKRHGVFRRSIRPDFENELHVSKR